MFSYLSLLKLSFSYERKAIEEWINTARDNGLPITSPKTAQTLDHCYLTTNIAIKNLIDEYRCGLGIPAAAVEDTVGPDTTPSRNSPAKKQQRVLSPSQAPPISDFANNTTSEVERVGIMIDQQLAEIQSMIWKLPSVGKAVSPVLATTSSTPSPSAIIPSKPIAVVTPRKMATKETTKENTNDAWTTVVQSKKTASVPVAAVVVTNGPGPKPSTSKKGSTSAAAVAKAAKEEAAAILAGQITKAFLCPSSRVRYVIGTKGVILKRLMSQSGATITTIATDIVPPGKNGNDSSEVAQIFTIKGSKAEVEKAEDLIASVSANGAKAIA